MTAAEGYDVAMPLVRRSRRTPSQRRRDFLYAVVTAGGAFAALVAGSAYGNIHSPRLGTKLLAWGCAAGFLVLGIVATRLVARGLGDVVAGRTLLSAGAAVRLLTTALGYLLVALGTLDVLGISVVRLLVGGALAGVVLGIAAQQSLGNVFAGFVLLVAHPFGVGDHIRVRSGALGGLFEGIVLGMSLTYVTLHTEGGTLKVPNSGMLAAAVGRIPVGPQFVERPSTPPVDAARTAPGGDPSGTGSTPGGGPDA